MVSVGGARNEVLEKHKNMCHHCGFFALPVTQRCSQCGIQYHDQCGPCMSPTSLCEVCAAVGQETVTRCYLCDASDDATLEATATDRLSLRIVYHGLHWRLASPDAAVPTGVINLAPSSSVALALKNDPHRMFHFSELPREGTHPMRVNVEHVGVFESVPLVVHSWCATCLFGVHPLHDNWKWQLLDSMFSCGTLAYGTMQAPVTRGGAECQFCHSSRGWLTFCHYHLTHAAGCDRCRDADDVTITRHAFHPSCAVRHGMQRMVKKQRAGMFCARQKHWRSYGLVPVKAWLGMLSGINHDLENVAGVLPASFINDEVLETPRKGSRYGNSMIPVRQL